MRVIAHRSGFARLSRRIAVALLTLVSFTAPGRVLYGQAEPTATRAGDLQVGATFSLANSDYAPNQFRGYGIFSAFDFRYHFGVVAEFHQLNSSQSSQVTYERTYEIGPRYVLHYGRLHPYAKGLFGRGVFNYPKVGPGLGANIAYNVAAGGGGIDYRLTRSVNLRVDYEYQKWFGFPLHGLTPAIVEAGVAYRFR